MSVEDVQKFRSAVSRQQDFQRSLQAEIAKARGGNMKDRTITALIALGSAQGYSFTADDLQQVATNSELTDAELEHIAGGGS